MNKHCSWITYKGCRFLFGNFSSIYNMEEYVSGIAEMEGEILLLPRGSKVPFLMDMSNSRLFKEVTDRARKMMSTLKEAGYPDSPTAIVGASGFQKAVISTIGLFRKDIQVFDDLQTARDWLAVQIKR